MGALSLVVIDGLNNWVGDVGSLLWMSAGYFFPFVSGIAMGSRGFGLQGRMVGALIGATVVVAPMLGYAVVETADAFVISLLIAFVPLALAQGAIALPVGASVSARRPVKG